MLAESKDWIWLMNQARRVSRHRRERVRVLAGKAELGHKSRSWQYVIQCATWCPVCERREREAKAQ